MDFHQAPTTFVSHVNLKVQHLEQSIQFYQDIMGFKVLEQSEQKALLTADGKHALLSIEQPNTIHPKEGRTTGLYHFALLLPKRADLANIVRHFMAIGIPFGSADHLVSEALYLSDPDGNGIEIYIDRDPSEWNWKNGEVDMTTDPLNFNELLSTNSQPWEGLPVDTVMGHIHLHVSELETAERFYTEGLGFEVVNRYGGQALFLSDGKYHHHIGLNTWAGVGAPAPSAGSVGLKMFSIYFPDQRARDRVITRLKHIGAPITEKANIFITHDPSGNRIQLTCSE